jgi:hypothetical protein
MFIEIANVCVTAQEPEQFVDDRFKMEFLRGKQRKAFAQIEPRLRSEDRQCACARAIGAGFPLFQDEPQEIVILPHPKRLTASANFCQRKNWRDDLPVVPFSSDATKRVHPVADLSYCSLGIRTASANPAYARPMSANAIASDAIGW